MDLIWICIIVGLVGAGAVAYFVRYVLRQDQGSEKIREISAPLKKEDWLLFIENIAHWAS